MRNKNLKNGIDESGLPTGFENWLKGYLKELCAQYKQQKRIKDNID